MAYIIYGAFALSIPIFYIWGVIAFLRTLSGNNTKQSSHSKHDRVLMEQLIAQVEENPHTTVQDFLRKVRGNIIRSNQPEPVRVLNAEMRVDRELTFEEAMLQADEDVAEHTFAELVAQPKVKGSQPTQPEFSWSNWYRDNAINLLLYLGAFLIVAAVTLFVGFQWQNMSSVVRFGLVITFTAAWYVAGFVVNRLRSLELAGLAFITIGAVLTPFCGFAYQRFIVGSMDGMGWTWLITAVVSTITYLSLSFGYQRRYFTYFANLSVLAMMLAVVQISEAPQEYFILTGTLTALILLMGRMALQMAPRLDAYLGQDVEASSLGILGVSVLLGLYLVPARGIDFFSIEVLAVLVVTAIYAWVYATMRTHIASVVSAQVLTVGAVAHGLMTFNVSGIIILYVILAIHLGLQWMLDRWLKREHKPIYFMSNTASILMTGILYLVSIFAYPAALYPMTFALVLMLHVAYYALRFEMPILFHLVAALCYAIAIHGLVYFQADDIISLFVLMTIGVVQVLSAYIRFEKSIIQAVVRTGLLGMGIMTVLCLFVGGNEIISVEPDRVLAIVSLGLMYTGLAVYALFSFTESYAEEKLLEPISHVFRASLGVICYGFSVTLELHVLAASLALVTGGLLLLAFRNYRHVLLVYAVTASVYLATTHLLFALNAPVQVFPIVLSVMSIALFLLEYALPILPADTHPHRKYTVLVALALTSLLTFVYVSATTNMALHLTGWMCSYTLISLLALSHDLFDRRAWEYIIGIVILAQYYWHIIFLQMFVNAALFNNPQWYFAAAGVFALVMSIRERGRDTDDTLVLVLELVSSLLFLGPTFAQSYGSGSLIYFALGIIYSLLFVAIGIMYPRRLTQQIGTVALILTVLIQTREFLFGLPRWLVVGVIGFAIMGVALYLSIRRRGEKRGKRAEGNP